MMDEILLVDLFPDPIKDDPTWPNNPAHAEIRATRPFTKRAFRDLKDVLSQLAVAALIPTE